jgi:hypothetical protein
MVKIQKQQKNTFQMKPVYQIHQNIESVFEWIEFNDLRSDVTIDAPQVDDFVISKVDEKLFGKAQFDAKLVLAQTSRNVGMSLKLCSIQKLDFCKLHLHTFCY